MGVDRVGVVAIGRNEGQRLIRCLESVLATGLTRVVYVDSGSIDGSCQAARERGVDVVELDLSIPFTAARARNAGFECLCQQYPDVTYVQFLDGDCELDPNWIATAVEALETDPQVSVVAGRRRERFPEQTIYNQLCDIEWNTPVGEARACGGDSLMRVAAVQQVGGFRADLIAGEEPELCVRLRQQGGKVLRLDAEMTRHDAQMTEFRQWWLRSVRAGYAYAEGSRLHGQPPECHWVRESRSIWFWGLLIPLVAVALVWPTHSLSLLLLLVYPLLVIKIYRSNRHQGYAAYPAGLYALFCVIAKFPQLQGQLQFHWRRLRRQPQQIIDYKSSVAKSPESKSPESKPQSVAP